MLSCRAHSKVKRRHTLHALGLGSLRHESPQESQPSFDPIIETIKYELMLVKNVLHLNNEIATIAGIGHARAVDHVYTETIPNTHDIQKIASGGNIHINENGLVLAVYPLAIGRMADTPTSKTNADSMKSLEDRPPKDVDIIPENHEYLHHKTLLSNFALTILLRSEARGLHPSALLKKWMKLQKTFHHHHNLPEMLK